MDFGGMNTLAIVAAAVAGWLIGAAWYMALSKPWIAALGKDMDTLKREQAARGKIAGLMPFVLSIVANFIMAYVLAGLIGHLGEGQTTLTNGIISGAFVWAGFVITTLTVNNAFAGPRYKLSVIDGGHWLAVLLAQGAIIGAFGV